LTEFDPKGKFRLVAVNVLNLA